VRFEEKRKKLSAEEKLDEAVEDLGGFGNFQIFAYLAVSSGLNACGFWFYQLGYLIQEPKYSCSLASGVNTANYDAICTTANICAGDPRITSSAIDWTNEASLHNWHLQYDLQCMPKAQQGLISSMFFLGWCVTLLWMPRLGDVYGRKKLILWDNFISLTMYLGVLVAPNIYVLAGLLFAWGFFASVRTNIGYCYLIELMPKKN